MIRFLEDRLDEVNIYLDKLEVEMSFSDNRSQAGIISKALDLGIERRLILKELSKKNG